jgi:hypothetical protein
MLMTDDTVIFVDNMQELKQLMEKFTTGSDINFNETKYMIISKITIRYCREQ